MASRFHTRLLAAVTLAVAMAVGGRGRAAQAAVAVPQGLAAAAPGRAARKNPFAADPSLRSLNSWYLRIALAAVVTENKAGLKKLAARMQKFAADKSKPYLWFPATRARTFCLAQMDGSDNEAAFIHSFAALCHARGVAKDQVKVIRFAQAICASLEKRKRTAWVDGAVAQGLPASGPAPGKLYMYLLNQRLGEMRSPIAKRHLIQASIGRAVIAAEAAKKVVQPPVVKPGRGGAGPGPLVMGYPLRYYQYKRALETLRFMAVWNDTQGLTAADLCRDGQNYFAAYGATGRFSASVFYAVLNQLYFVHQALPKPAQKARILAQGNWLGDWYAKIIAKPGPLVEQIKARWQQWQALR